MRVRVGYEGARHIPLIDHGEGLDEEVVASTFEGEKPRPRAELLTHAAADLAWAVAEIERLGTALHAVAAITGAIRYERGEDGPIAVAAWLVEPTHMGAARATLGDGPDQVPPRVAQEARR
jgi:hypothetical protein